MRRVLVIGLATAVALTAVGTAGAATPRERAQIQARASLERALASSAAAATPQIHAGRRCVLRQLRMSFGRLSPADRQVAKAILARPTDGHNGDWTAPKSARKHVCKTDFCIHWVKKTRDAPSLADDNHDGIPNYVQNVINVMNHVWAKEIDELQLSQADGRRELRVPPRRQPEQQGRHLPSGRRRGRPLRLLHHG